MSKIYQFNSIAVSAISLDDGSLLNTSPSINFSTVAFDGFGFCSLGPDGRVYVWGTNAVGGPWWLSIDSQLNGPWVNGPVVIEPVNTWAGGAGFVDDSIIAVGDKLRVLGTFEFVGMQFPDTTSPAHSDIALMDLDSEGDVRSTYSSSYSGDSIYFASGGRWANRLSITNGFSRALDSWVVAGEPMVIVSAAVNPDDGRVYAYGVNGAGVTGNPSATDALLSCSLGGSDVRVEQSWVKTLTDGEGYGFESSMVINDGYIYFVTQNSFFHGGTIHRYQISTRVHEERWTHVADGQICGPDLSLGYLSATVRNTGTEFYQRFTASSG